MKDLKRREALQVMSAGLAFVVTPPEIARAAQAIREHRRIPSQALTQAPQFFSDHEWRTVRLLVDLIIPRDERSGSATDAGVPEFIDFIMTDGDEGRRTAMRGGLAWLDTECRKRFHKHFIDCDESERTAVLDDVAYARQTPPSMSHGARFFTSFRNMTASGFWSSKMGVEDLQYMGNTVVAEWTGCPEDQLIRLGLDAKAR